MVPQPGFGGMRSDLLEASPPLAGVLIWRCSSEGEHAEVWLATGFLVCLILWVFFFIFLVSFWFLFVCLFFTSGSFGAAGFCCDYFWFSLLLVSLFPFFFFLVGLFFWSFLPCHSALRTLCVPTTGLLALFPGEGPRQGSEEWEGRHGWPSLRFGRCLGPPWASRGLCGHLAASGGGGGG